MSYLLSIIIPTKNRYQYLQECLLSLRKLTPGESKSSSRTTVTILPHSKIFSTTLKLRISGIIIRTVFFHKRITAISPFRMLPENTAASSEMTIRYRL